MQRKEHMNFRNWFWPLTGAVAVGFLAGACARDTSGGQTRGGALNGDALNGGALQEAALESPALAQTDKSAPGNIGQLQNLSATYAAIAKKVTPAVVNINSEQVIPGRVLRDPFGDFFGGGRTLREPDRKELGLGSGVIVDSSGIIITNNHVIDNASRVTVTLHDRRRFPAKVLGTDPGSDIAVLKIESGKALPTVPWADSDALQVGDIVLAVGSPFGLASTVTQGIISAKERRDLGISQFEDFLQTDAAINPGNSGGALVDISGRLVGINTAILGSGGGGAQRGNIGIGLAIPAKLARSISGQLARGGRVARGWLGIGAEPVTEEMARQIGLPSAQGLIVTGVVNNSPAASLPWLREGYNVLLKINGTPVETQGHLSSIIAGAEPGAKLALEVWQNGQSRNMTAVVGRRPSPLPGA